MLQLERVRKLDLSNNRIPKIEHLENCVLLDTLVLNNNGITSVQHINQSVGNIRILLLQNNMLDSTQGLEKLFGLERLDLSGNRIEPLVELQRLGDLPMLSELCLNGNPLTKKKGYRESAIAWLSSTLSVLDGEPLSRREKELNLTSSALRGGFVPDIHVTTTKARGLRFW